MKRYLLDTNALSDFINHRRGVGIRVQEARRGGCRIGTCVPVIGEIYFGLEQSRTRDDNEKQIWIGINRIIIWPFDLAAGKEFGRLRAVLKRIGRPMQIVDIQLAAIALTLGNCTVVTTDADLAAVPGLRTENSTTSIS